MIENFLSTHSQALSLRAKRTKIIASNIANADTPNYKAKDLAFAEVMKDVKGRNTNSLSLKMSSSNSAQQLRTTDTRHINVAGNSASTNVMYRIPETASLDGNTVDKDLEQARFAENTVRYQASLEFINSRVGGLIRALKGE